MKSREMLYLESELTKLSSRQVMISEPSSTSLRIVLEPVEDRGRMELIARLDDGEWTVSDRGFSAAIYGSDLDFVVDKFADFGCRVRQRGDELVAEVRDRAFAESIAQFVATLEFIPVLAGFWAGRYAAA